MRMVFVAAPYHTLLLSASNSCTAVCTRGTVTVVIVDLPSTPGSLLHVASACDGSLHDEGQRQTG